MRISTRPYTHSLTPQPDGQGGVVWPQTITVGFDQLSRMEPVLYGVEVYLDPRRDDHECIVVFEVTTLAGEVVGEPLGRFILTGQELAKLKDPLTAETIYLILGSLVPRTGSVTLAELAAE